MVEPTERSFSQDFWLNFGDDADPSTRDKMVFLGIEQISNVGPVDFNSAVVCDALGVKKSLVTHYFGSKEKFVAEIIWEAYQMWSANVDRNFRTAKANPKSRLKAFVDGEVEWARKMGSVHTLINYPMLSGKSLAVLAETHQSAMQSAFEYHLALLTVTVRDIHKGTVSPLDFDATTIPRAALLANPRYFLTATQISWATHGLASWSSGKHVATTNLENPQISNLTSEYAARQMIKTILAMAER